MSLASLLFVKIDKPLNSLFAPVYSTTDDPDAKFVVKLCFAFMAFCVCETLLLRDSILCNTCRETQHVTGTVSNEATSGMGRED